MNIDQLRTFYVLAKKGSFSRTAEELAVTQPAVSIHIKSLEKFFGVGLFDRVDKRLVLTEAGEILNTYAERIFNLIDETKSALSDFSDLHRGNLHLGASSNIGVYTLPCILGDFKKRFPMIDIQVFIGTTNMIERKILNNELALGLVEAEVRCPEVVREHWRDEKLVLIVSPKHTWAKLQSIKPSQLVGQPFIVGERGSGTGRVLQEKLPTIANKLEIFLELGGTEAVKRAVEENLGISIVAQNTVSRELKSGSLRAIQINDIGLSKEFSIIYLKGKVITSAMKEFLTCLRSSEC